MEYRHTPADHEEVHLALRHIVSQTRIASPDDLCRMLGDIETAIQRELDQQHIVIIE
jgi:hypothetical protein